MARKSSGSRAEPTLIDEDLPYTQDEFLVPPVDSHGHSVKLWVRIPPALERQLEVILAAKVFPYETVSDIVRHAVERHAAWMTRVKPHVKRTYLGHLAMSNETVREEEMKISTEKLFRDVTERLRQHTVAGDFGEAKRIVLLIYDHLRDVPDCAWKRRFVKDFEGIAATANPPQVEATTAVEPEPEPQQAQESSGQPKRGLERLQREVVPLFYGSADVRLFNEVDNEEADTEYCIEVPVGGDE